jgi:hypothetical protein
MGIVKGVAASLAAGAMLCSVPASAGAIDDAEKLRRLDIMLMVSGLRCRTTADDFQADYGQFTTAHYATLNGAARVLRTDMAQRHGAAGATRALDKLSVTMANDYGSGHPWLTCAQLKQVTRDLVVARGAAPLLAAADQLLAQTGTPTFAWARK